MQNYEYNSNTDQRSCSRNMRLSWIVQERKLLRGRLDSIGTLAVNSFSKVLSIPLKKKLNEYSPVRQAYMLAAKPLLHAFINNRRTALIHMRFFLVKKTFSSVAVSQQSLVVYLSTSTKWLQAYSGLAQSKFRRIIDKNPEYSATLRSVWFHLLEAMIMIWLTFSFEWVFRIEPITNVENREPTSVFIIQEGDVLQNRPENRMNFNSKTQNISTKILMKNFRRSKTISRLRHVR